MSTIESYAEEVRRLRNTMRDLVALSTLPAVWAGSSPENIVQGLAEILHCTLKLDLIYIQVRDGHPAGDVEFARAKGIAADPSMLRAVAGALAPWLTPGTTEVPPTVIDPVGERELRVAVARFGYMGNEGAVVACSSQKDFPTETDRLLLSFGTNQTTIVLQRKRAQRSLAEERERYRTTLASIGDGVIATDVEGRVTFMNGVAEAVTGWTQADANARPLHEVFHIVNEYTRQPVENPALRALREGTVVGLANHTVLIGRDGNDRPIDDSAAPIRDGSGNPAGVVLVFRDVSDRKRAEEVRGRLAAIVESSHDAILSKSLDGTILSWNVGAERLFDYAPAEAIGRNITLIIPPERREEEHEILARIVNGERVDHFETVRISKHGRRMDISLTVSPIRDSAGRIIGASKVARDITDRKRIEKALREEDRRKDEFIALLAHELRNPLAPLRNGLQVMRMGADDADAVAQAREMMDRQLGHMIRLVDDLLDISRIGQNKMELRRTRVLLADIVSSAVETARPTIEAGGHELTISVPADAVHLDADLTRLAQVFSNLLTNSAKYTEHGGRIWLTAERKGGEVAVTVRDTGIGIPEESLPRIFDMFSQVDRSIERSTGGLGIGLALVKGLVEMHDGTVTAASEGQGTGSTFTVTLPVLRIRTKSSVAAPVDNADVTIGPKRRILVVDDNRDSATSMAMMLKLMGNEAWTAHDGIEAIDAAEKFRPQVILMDVGMPRLSGYDATRRIRDQPWGGSVVIIALTGWGQPDDKVRSQAAGCNGHLVKPVNLPDLEKLLGELTDDACTRD